MRRAIRAPQGKRRGGTEYHTLMHKVAGQLTEEQIRAVTKYYAASAER